MDKSKVRIIEGPYGHQDSGPYPGGGRSLDTGFWLTAEHEGEVLCRIFVMADYRYDPDGLNRRGQKGCYRSEYPSAEKIAAARRKLVRQARRILKARECR